MTVFVILAPTDRSDLDSAIRSTFPDNFLKITGGQWLVSARNLTSQEVVTKLEAHGGQKGQIVAFGISGYWGWHDNSIWEWIQTKMAA